MLRIGIIDAKVEQRSGLEEGRWYACEERMDRCLLWTGHE